MKNDIYNRKSIIWDGTNTKEVVEFCSQNKFKNGLCHIHSTYKNLQTGILTLCIEPGEIMRQSTFHIPLNSEVIVNKNKCLIIKEETNESTK